MQLKHIKNVLVSIGAVALIIGCAPLAPVQNIDSDEVTTNRPATLDEVGNAIVRAGASLNMQMHKVRPGLISATYAVRGLSATMEIKYDSKHFSITYKDSQGLKYDGTQIHKNYNGWVQNLDNRIKAQLSTL